MRQIALLCCLCVVAVLSAGDPAPTSYAPMVKRVSPSVVTIYASSEQKRPQLPPGMQDDPAFRRFFGDLPRGPGRRQQGQGSGVMVTADGYLLTNNHVIEDADELSIGLSNEHDGHEIRIPATVVGTDPKTDLAVLKIDPQGRTLPIVTWADSAKVEAGDLAFAIGNPFGVGQTVTMGIISATGRAKVGIIVDGYEDFLQTDASINPGNSGGALVDAAGRLVGINTAILSPSGGNLGIGFAVPANLARQIFDAIRKDGRVVRGYMGVMIQEVTTALANKLKLPTSAGALVGGVVADSPAEKAGLKPGDVITKLESTAITEPAQLRLLIAQLSPGTTVTLGLWRDGAAQEAKVVLRDLPGSAQTDAADEPETAKSSVGIRLEDLNPALRRRLDLPPRVEGVLIAEVRPSSRAERAGLKAGDLITEIDRAAVDSAAAAVAALRSAKGEILLRIWSDGASRFVVVPE